MQDLNITCDHSAGIIYFKGEFTAVSASYIRAHILMALGAITDSTSDNVTFDFEGVTGADITFFQIIESTHLYILHENCDLVLRNVPPGMCDVCRGSGLFKRRTCDITMKTCVLAAEWRPMRG